MNRLRCALISILALCLAWPAPSEAYSVLTHEAIIDAAWETNIRPVLLARFPNATPDDLRPRPYRSADLTHPAAARRLPEPDQPLVAVRAHEDDGGELGKQQCLKGGDLHRSSVCHL